MNEFSTTTERLDHGTNLLSVQGELDIETAPQFESALGCAQQASAADHRFQRMRLLDSSAPRVLVKASKLPNATEPLTLIIPKANLRKVFEITHLDVRFDIRQTRATTPNGGIAPQIAT